MNDSSRPPLVYKPVNKVRFVTAASLFDGHDASINIMRRILQATGCEVIHLGHNRSVEEIVNCALQEDALGLDPRQRVYSPLAQVGERLRPPGGLGELRAARAAQDRAARLDDAADVARGERLEDADQEAGIAVAYREHLAAAGQRAAGHGPHRRIHAGRVAAARQDCNLFQAGHSNDP